MEDLVSFLLDRIAEDEAVTFGCGRGWIGPETVGAFDGSDAVMVSPKRLYEECEVRRLLIRRASLILESRDHVLSGQVEQAAFPDVNRRECSQARDTLRHLALPYAAHPDYRQSWKP